LTILLSVTQMNGKGYKCRMLLPFMDIKAQIEWLITFLVIVGGFGLILTSVSELSHVHFVAGLLLFTVGTYWYAYRKGYFMGKYDALVEQRKEEK